VVESVYVEQGEVPQGAKKGRAYLKLEDYMTREEDRRSFCGRCNTKKWGQVTNNAFETRDQRIKEGWKGVHTIEFFQGWIRVFKKKRRGGT